MSDAFDVYNLLDSIWDEPLLSGVTFKKIDISKYPDVSREIPDRFVLIKRVFSKSELVDMWGNLESCLGGYQIFPFLGTLGDAIICIGYGCLNKGRIFYFDFDFGCFELNGDELQEFLGKLVPV